MDFPDTPPEDDKQFKLEMWKLMKSIKLDTVAANEKIVELDNRVSIIETGAENVGTRVSDIENKIDELTTKLDSTSSELAIANQEITLLDAKLMKSEIKSMHLGNEVDDLRAHSMKYNLLFNFDKSYAAGKEIRSENSIDIVKTFLSTVMGIDTRDIYIPVAHRVGVSAPNRERPILAKFPVSSQLNTVMKNTGRLRGTGHFVSVQATQRRHERKQFVLRKYQEAKQQYGTDARLSGDKLYINGQLQAQYMDPRLPPSDADSYQINTSNDKVTDRGSTFHGYVAKVNTLQDISDALNTLRRDPDVAKCPHIMYAYRLKGNTTHVRDNFSSDNDHGVGLRLLKYMETENITNCVLFATRECLGNFEHIGIKRYQHVIDLCRKAYEQLNHTD